TPFKGDFSIDFDALGRLVDYHLEHGTDGIVPCGCTGEAATLAHEEQEQVIRFVIERVEGRVPVIAGTGSNSTAEAIEISLHAKEMGADAVLLVSPYYNKPTQEGLYQHYKALAEKVPLPQVLYNVPGRTGMNMEAATTIRLAEFKNVVAIKEASGNVTQSGEIIAAAGDKIDVLSGDDFLTLPLMACGAKGVISVTANIAPAQVKAMVTAINEGRWDDARALHLRLLDLHQTMFIEANPVPVKTSLALMGMGGSHVRLPLVDMEPANLEKLKSVLKKHQLVGQ
ncbi:MAG: 4-hydroxy-tetrahydrodipicolinate synthase, partial [Bradymonadaceae bacterium]